MAVLFFLLKIAPLAIVFRSGLCKLNTLKCESDANFRCASAVPLLDEKFMCGIANNGTGTTAESLDWAGQVWVPHWQARLDQAVEAIPADLPFAVPKIEADKLVLAIGAAEVVGYLMLWFGFPTLGAFIIVAVFAGALDTHMTAMGDAVDALGLQIAVLCAALYILLFHSPAAGKEKAE